ncbi:RXT2-like protein [Scheffersomyces amazonensis]|uniref:RXT2-like protein n=1 Tax=Scheffersomyces amazonensis TaxID=1078765 RepID=UPI00315D1E8C
MLDGVSLEIISRFKQAVLTAKSISNDNAEIASSNRGNKLYQPSTNSLEALKSKIVEYDGINHLVLTNETIERSNINNKRKWNDTYGDSSSNIDNHVYIDDNDKDDHDQDQDQDDIQENEDDDDHPLKKIKLGEILAPLNHPSEVVSHPSISKTYKSVIFNKLANELIELIEVEQTNLNWLNKLLQVLNGEDWFYLLEENLGLKDYDHGLNDDKLSNEVRDRSQKNGESKETEVKTEKEKEKDSNDEIDPFFALPQTLKRYEEHQLAINSEQQNDDQEYSLKQDLINYLQVSIQRQHEYIKNLSQLRNGIVRADRLKKDIYKWGKEMHDKRSN